MDKDNPAPGFLNEGAVGLGLADARFQGARNFIARHLETMFVLFTAIIVVVVFYYLPYKIAFLNLFYLPVIATAYFMGKRQAVMGAVLALLSGVLFAYYRPEWFEVPSSRLDAFLVLAAWGGFLILATASIGSLQEKVARGLSETRRLYEELKVGRGVEEAKVKVEKTLFAAMDPVVAKLATEGRLRFEKREISIVFASLAGFTAYSDSNRPDLVLEELNRFLGEVEPIVENYHGHIDKFFGDGAMAEFGAPVDFDQHALMAVAAGLKLQQKVAGLDLTWPLRVGIATGSAVIGMLGVRRQAYSALGDSVNIAKRLEEVCAPGKIYVDEATFLSVEHYALASKVRDSGPIRKADEEALERLSKLEEQLRRQGESSELLYALGRLQLQLRDAGAAIGYLGKALTLDPASTEIKLAYADANMKRKEFEQIQLKGKARKLTVYEVSGFKDRWSDPAVIPAPVAARYQAAQAYLEVPEDVVQAVEVLDGSVGNSRCVALLSYALADRMGLNEEMKRIILRAGYLQSLGKGTVPHRILNQVGSLTDQESKLLERYPAESAAACKRLGFNDPRLLEIVLHHHEALDGSGYPEHLRGESIPQGARITTVAETYCALTSWRPFREPWESSTALNEIRKGMDKGHYDPQVAEALLGLIPSPS